MLPLFFKGRKRVLDQDDLYDPLPSHKSNLLGDTLSQAWENEVKKKTAEGKPPSLLKAGIKVFGGQLILSGILLFILEIGIRMVQPIFIMGVVAYFSKIDGNVNEGYLYAGGLIACSVLNVVFVHPVMFSQAHLGMKMRVASMSMIYRKTLKLTKNALGETTAGQVVNLISNDVGRFETSILFIHYLWIAPLELIAVSVILFYVISYSAFIGVGFILLLLPIQGR